MSSLNFKLTDGDEVGVVVHILNSFEGPSLLFLRWALNDINANQVREYKICNLTVVIFEKKETVPYDGQNDVNSQSQMSRLLYSEILSLKSAVL